MKYFILTVNTFWNSCADASHYYGTLVGEDFKRQIYRSYSRREVEKKAKEILAQMHNGRYTLTIKKETEHL